MNMERERGRGRESMQQMKSKTNHKGNIK